MQTIQGFELRTIAGEAIIVATGSEHIDFGRIITLNPSAAYLWQHVAGKEFSADYLAELLVQEYEVDHATAHQDSLELIELWLNAGIIAP